MRFPSSSYIVEPYKTKCNYFLPVKPPLRLPTRNDFPFQILYLVLLGLLVFGAFWLTLHDPPPSADKGQSARLTSLSPQGLAQGEEGQAFLRMTVTTVTRRIWDGELQPKLRSRQFASLPNSRRAMSLWQLTISLAGSTDNRERAGTQTTCLLESQSAGSLTLISL